VDRPLSTNTLVPGVFSNAGFGLYGKTQMGTYIDVVETIVEWPILGWENAKINLALRLEYVDYNQDAFTETGGVFLKKGAVSKEKLLRQPLFFV